MIRKLLIAAALAVTLTVICSCGATPGNSGNSGNVENTALETGADLEYIVPGDMAALSVFGKDGEIILEAAALTLNGTEEKNVFDVTAEILRNEKIALVFSGSGEFAYVQGINGLFEFDHGGGSGWMYSVDGEFMGYGAGNYTLKGGEFIEWHYTLNFGEDLGVIPE